MHLFLFKYFNIIPAILLIFTIQPLYSLQAKTPKSYQISSLKSNQTKEADRLYNQGVDEYQNSQFQQALITFQKALVIYQQTASLSDIANTLRAIGNIHYQISNYSQALTMLDQALIIYRDIGDNQKVVYTLNSLGAVYNNLSQYSQAINYYQQALIISQKLNDKKATLITLNNIGSTYQSQSQYDEAIKYYYQSLEISKEIGDSKYIEASLNNIGIIYYLKGKYYQAIDFYQQSLDFAKSANNLKEQGNIFNNIGLVYHSLGQYDAALRYYQQALTIRKKINDAVGEGKTLHNIGFAYSNKKQYFLAISFYKQAIAVFRKIGYQSSLGNTLNNIGYTYQKLGQYSQALKYLEEALSIVQLSGDRRIKGNTLDSIGTVYKNNGKLAQALILYQQALAIRKDIGDRPGERITLSNIGDLLSEQKKPELAIIFYKQSVNITEAIRKELNPLPREQRKSYTGTIADTYRRLADLLLQQDRVLEAQQVLDLLKIQEIDDYLHNVRGNEITSRGVVSLPPEQQLSQGLDEITTRQVQIMRQLAELEKIPQAQRKPEQWAKIYELNAAFREDFQKFIDSPEVNAWLEQLSKKEISQIISLKDINIWKGTLQRLNQNAVLLYPLILDDRLELVVTTPYSSPIHKKVSVKKADLDKTIIEFRDALTNPKSDATIPGKKLYQWLIKPIEKQLETVQTKTIIYLPDTRLRYIPLAALYDGKQWLAQRFQIQYITSASLLEISTKPKPLSEVKVFAGAATDYYSITAGKYNHSFPSLKFAGVEVDNLAAMIPGTKKLVDSEFNYKATIPYLNIYTIVHLATHAMFVTGQPEDSFILLGDKSLITLPDIGKLSLSNVDLVVLSACQTGVGGIGNGEEILGFGYQMQYAGARAAIASLWSVNDGGTQTLMNTFYALLHQGNNITKAEALSQAQVIMITGDFKTISSQQDRVILQSTRNNLSPNVANNLSHPYYWAPFILIGNGL